ncbi:hypothetical protein B484DRAFT_397029 [Ochromonadaceae sp. CCMP2298]|nr:hypothetical protein B484DRAFT_397029 [Ochromonadaceae sp. CCMP2298]
MPSGHQNEYQNIANRKATPGKPSNPNNKEDSVDKGTWEGWQQAIQSTLVNPTKRQVSFEEKENLGGDIPATTPVKPVGILRNASHEERGSVLSASKPAPASAAKYGGILSKLNIRVLHRKSFYGSPDGGTPSKATPSKVQADSPNTDAISSVAISAEVTPEKCVAMGELVTAEEKSEAPVPKEASPTFVPHVPYRYTPHCSPHVPYRAHSANSRRSMESMQEWSSGGGFKKAQPLSMDDTDCRFNMNKQLFEAENEEVAGLSSTTPRKFAAYLQEVEQTSAAQAQAIEDVRKLTAIVSSAQVFTKKFRAKPSEVVVEAVPETAVEAAAPSVAVVGSKPLSMRLFLSIALLLVVFVGLFFGTTHTIPALSAMGTADTVVPSTLVTQAPRYP